MKILNQLVLHQLNEYIKNMLLIQRINILKHSHIKLSNTKIFWWEFLQIKQEDKNI